MSELPEQEIEITYGPLEERDAVACALLERTLFAEESPWSEAAFRAEIAQPWTRYVAARDGQALIGYAGVAVRGPSEDPDFEIHTVAVDPQWQGYGIGRALTEILLEVVDRSGGPCFLEVRVDNTAAIALYESVGFTITGRRRGYYQPSGADAWTMVRPAQGREE